MKEQKVGRKLVQPMADSKFLPCANLAYLLQATIFPWGTWEYLP
jgi:hypothetical protein